MNVELQWSLRGRDYSAEAVAAASKADVALLFLGLSPRSKARKMPVQIQGFSGGDRLTIDLPKAQEDLIARRVGYRDAHRACVAQRQRTRRKLGRCKHSRHRGSMVPGPAAAQQLPMFSLATTIRRPPPRDIL